MATLEAKSMNDEPLMSLPSHDAPSHWQAIYLPSSLCGLRMLEAQTYDVTGDENIYVFVSINTRSNSPRRTPHPLHSLVGFCNVLWVCYGLFPWKARKILRMMILATATIV